MCQHTITQERNMTDKPKHANVHVALAAAQAAMKAPEKNAENPAFKRDGKPMKYADLSSVVESIRKPLTDNGLTWGWRSEYAADAGLWVWTAFIAHGESGTEVCCAVPINASTGNNHAFKSAVTYAKRIGLESVSGQSPGDDDDGNASAGVVDAPRVSPASAHEKAVAEAIDRLAIADTLDELRHVFTSLPKPIAADPRVIKAKDARKDALAAPAADQPAADLGGDKIPY
jgi:hypothetical protein